MPILARSLWIVAGLLTPSLAGAGDVRPLAVFDFELINTSLEAERPDETQRLAMLNAMLRERLAALDRFRLVDIAPLRQRIANSPQLRNCNGCEVDLARELGAEVVATGTVQKVSNLILNINLALKEVPSGAVISGGSVDIRGNFDESWRRGLDRLLRNQGLAPAPASDTARQ
ncbi:MAG TPA: DUF3280 domain-containing protein [Alphaproteobacteria bacterium]|nr:DUF3280 domain-containing protein [Alphaproteobacteria bacterium]